VEWAPLPPSPWPRRLRLGAGVLIGLLVMVLVWRGIRRWRAARARPALPHERALARLEQMPADPVAAVTHLDLVLREYLAERFAVEALLKTTKELESALEENTDLPAGQRADLADLLAWCDLGKFANVEVDGVREACDRARRFVAATAPVGQGRANGQARSSGEKQGDAKAG
jgi:hypothetical protein